MFRLIKKSKNDSPYHSVVHGLLFSDEKALLEGIKNGANLMNIEISNANVKTEYKNYLEENSKNTYFSVLDFSLAYCNYKIVEIVVNNLKTDNNISLVIKTLKDASDVISKSDNSYSKPIKVDVLPILKKYVNKENVNKLVELDYRPFEDYYGSDQTCKLSLLHWACYFTNLEAVSFLLKMGANPKSKGTTPDIFGNKQEPSLPLEEINIPGKEKQSETIKAIAEEFLRYGFDIFSHPNCVNRLSKEMNKKDLAKLIKNKEIKNIESFQVLKRKGTMVNRELSKENNSFEDYPLINDIFKHEKLNIKFSGELTPSQIRFLKEKKLKTALMDRYGISSPVLTTFFSSQVLQRNNDRGNLLVCSGSFSYIDKALKLFTKNKTLEQNSFLTVVKDHELYYSISVLEDKTITFLQNFQNSFILNLLKKVGNDKNSFSNYLIETLINDAASVYNQKAKDLNYILKLPKNRINSIEKLHDELVAASNILKHKNLPLNQDAHYPNIKKINGTSIKENFSIIIPKDSHTLLKWGQEMNHCIHSYTDKAQDGKSLLLAIAEDGLAKYAVEIKSKQINQVQGNSNSKPPPDILSKFTKILKNAKLIN